MEDVKFFLRGRSVHATDNEERTPLHLACVRYYNAVNREVLVSYLLNMGAKTDAKDLYGDLPIHLAAACELPGSEKAIVMMINAGGVYAKNSAGKTAAQCILENCDTENIAMAMKRCPFLDWKIAGDGNLLHVARAWAFVALSSIAPERLLDEVNAENKTPLQIQRSYGDAGDTMGRSPLMLSMSVSPPAIAKAVINACTEEEIVKPDGENRNCVHYAAENRNPSTALEIIKRGAAVKRGQELMTLRRNEDGWTPLHALSVRHGRVAIEEAIKAGKVNNIGAIVDLKKRTPLHIAAESGNAEAFAVLMDMSPESLVKEVRWILAPICHAFTDRALACVIAGSTSEMVRQNVLNWRDSNGKNALHRSCGNFESARALGKAYGKLLVSKDDSGRIPLVDCLKRMGRAEDIVEIARMTSASYGGAMVRVPGALESLKLNRNHKKDGGFWLWVARPLLKFGFVSLEDISEAFGVFGASQITDPMGRLPLPGVGEPRLKLELVTLTKKNRELAAEVEKLKLELETSEEERKRPTKNPEPTPEPWKATGMDLAVKEILSMDPKEIYCLLSSKTVGGIIVERAIPEMAVEVLWHYARARESVGERIAKLIKLSVERINAPTSQTLGQIRDLAGKIPSGESRLREIKRGINEILNKLSNLSELDKALAKNVAVLERPTLKVLRNDYERAIFKVVEIKTEKNDLKKFQAKLGKCNDTGKFGKLWKEAAKKNYYRNDTVINASHSWNAYELAEDYSSKHGGEDVFIKNVSVGELNSINADWARSLRVELIKRAFTLKDDAGLLDAISQKTKNDDPQSLLDRIIYSGRKDERREVIEEAIDVKYKGKLPGVTGNPLIAEETGVIAKFDGKFYRNTFYSSHKTRREKVIELTIDSIIGDLQGFGTGGAKGSVRRTACLLAGKSGSGKSKLWDDASKSLGLKLWDFAGGNQLKIDSVKTVAYYFKDGRAIQFPFVVRFDDGETGNFVQMDHVVSTGKGGWSIDAFKGSKNYKRGLKDQTVGSSRSNFASALRDARTETVAKMQWTANGVPIGSHESTRCHVLKEITVKRMDGEGRDYVVSFYIPSGNEAVREAQRKEAIIFNTAYMDFDNLIDQLRYRTKQSRAAPRATELLKEVSKNLSENLSWVRIMYCVWPGAEKILGQKLYVQETKKYLESAQKIGTDSRRNKERILSTKSKIESAMLRNLLT